MNLRLSAVPSILSKELVKLSPGDRLVAYVLCAAFFLSAVFGLVALERSFMVAAPAHGGSLTEGVLGSPRFVNPLLAITDADRDLATLTYAGLMGIGPDGLIPVLAESYTISEDGKTYTFTLRENAKWSDGRPITSGDVVFTIQKAVDPKIKSPERPNWLNVRVEAVDARTVKFTLPKAYAPFLENTTLGILPSHIWSKIPDEQFPFSLYMSQPVGAGPYVVDSVKLSSTGAITRYSLKANKDYVLGKPYLGAIHFVFYDSASDLLHAYESGVVESAYGTPVAGAMRAPYSRVFAVFLNPANNKALADAAVREALSVSINREDIVNVILGGFAEPRTSPLPLAADAGEQPENSERIERAKEILNAGGWRYNEETAVWTHSGKKLTLDEITIKTSNIPELRTLTAEIEKNFEAIGVKAAIEYYEPSTLSGDVIRPRAYDALYFGLVIGHGGDLYPFFDSGERTGAGLNIALYSNREVDALLEKARLEQDAQVRRELLEEASQKIAEDHGALFTHTPYFTYAVPPDLKGVILPVITTPSDRFATVSTWYRRTHYVWPFFAN